MVYFQDRGQGQTQPPFKPFSQGMFSGGSAFERSTGLEDPDREEKVKLASQINQTLQTNINPDDYTYEQLLDIGFRSNNQNIQQVKAEQGLYQAPVEAQRVQDFMTLEQINAGVPKPIEAPILTADQLKALDPSNPRPLTPELQKVKEQLNAGFEDTLKNSYEIQNRQKLIAELGPEYQGVDLNTLFDQYNQKEQLRKQVVGEGYVETEKEPWEQAIKNYDIRKKLMEQELLPILSEAQLGKMPEKERAAYEDRLQLQGERLFKQNLIDTSELTEEQARLLDTSSLSDIPINLIEFLKKSGPGMAKFAYRSLSGGGLGGVKTSYDFLSSLTRAYAEGNNPETDKVADEILKYGAAPVLKEINNKETDVTVRPSLVDIQDPSLFAQTIDGMNISDTEKEALKTVGYGVGGGIANLTKKAGGILETIAELEQTRLGQLAKIAVPNVPVSIVSTKTKKEIGAKTQEVSEEFIQKLETEAASQGLLGATRGGAMVMEEIVLSPLYATGTRGVLRAAQLATRGTIKGGEYAVRGAGLLSPYIPGATRVAAKGATAAARIGGKAATTVAGGIAGGMAASGGGPAAVVGGALLGMLGSKTVGGLAGKAARGIGRMILGKGAKEAAEVAGAKVATKVIPGLSKSQQIVTRIFEEHGPIAASKLATKMARTADLVGNAELSGYWWDVAGTALNIGMVNGMIEGMAAGDVKVGFNSFLLGAGFGAAGGLLLRSSLPSNLKLAKNVFNKEELALVKNSADREMASLAQSNFGDDVRIVFAESPEKADLLARQYVTTGSKGEPFKQRGKQFKTPGEVAKGSYLVQDASAPGTLKLILYPDANGRYANSLLDSLPDALMRGSSNPGARAKLAKAVYESVPASQLDAFAKARGFQDYRTNAQSAQQLVSEVIKEQMRIAGKDVFYPAAKGFDARAAYREFQNKGGDSELGVFPEVVRSVQGVLQVNPKADVIAIKNNNVWKIRPKRNAVPQPKSKGVEPEPKGVEPKPKSSADTGPLERRVVEVPEDVVPQNVQTGMTGETQGVVSGGVVQTPKSTASVATTERIQARQAENLPKTSKVITKPVAPSTENVINYPVRARDIGGGKAEIEVKLRNGDTIPVTVDAELVPNLKSDWSESTVPFQIDEATGQAFIPGRRDLWTNKRNIVAVEEAPIDVTKLSPRDKAIARSEARKEAKKLKEPKEIAELNSQDPDALDWDSLKDDAIDAYSKAPNKADWEAKMTEKLTKKKKGGFVSADWLPNLLSRLWDSMKNVFDTIKTKYQSSRFASTRGAVGDLTGKAEGGLKIGDDPLHQLLKDTTNAEKNLKLREKLQPGVGVAKNPLTRFHNSEGKPIYVGADFADGGKPFRGWIEETQAWSTPKEIQADRVWYKELKSNFDEIFGTEDSGKMMMSWLASQQNASPISGMQNMFRVEDRLAGIKSKMGGLADAKVEGILRGKVPEKGFGAKLTDFVDAGFGRDTRTYMGNKATAGRPFVADVHTGRDSGHVDQQTLTRLFKMSKDEDLFIDGQKAVVEITKTKEATIKGKKVTQPSEVKVTVGNESFELTTDMTGSPSGGRYEGISNWGNKLTDHLNEINWMGGNWTPAEVQAVGWMRTLKQYDLPQGTLATALQRNTGDIAAEVNFSSGYRLPMEFPGITAQTPAAQRAITSEVLNKVTPELLEITGGSARVRSIAATAGKFGGEPSPSVVTKMLGSPEARDLYSTAQAYVSEQAATMSTTFGVGGKNSRAIIFRKADGTKFTPEEIASLGEVKEVPGFTVEQIEQGASGLILGTKRGTYNPKGFTALQAKKVKDGLNKWAKDNKIQLDVNNEPVQVTTYSNDWTVNKQGEAYLDKIRELGGDERVAKLIEYKNNRYPEILRESYQKHAKESYDEYVKNMVTQQE